MHPLDYRTPPRPQPPREQTAVDAAVVLLPLAATAVSFAVAWHSGAEEPFGAFAWSDAVMQVGGPLLALALWAMWLRLALLKRPVTPLVLVPTICWMALCLLFTTWLGVGYFSEPWNR
jgi:hypothetical protein